MLLNIDFRRNLIITRMRPYRADIDGLRGLAIIVVMLFHYHITVISGGFVGVDIFFVISGFLITQNILTDIQQGTWSYARFYTRRVRRLFPTLFVTLIGSLLAAFVLLMPNDLVWFASTVVHSACSTSNFLYWTELGYFGPATERTPLLHTWSLSVEEQFYLLWPTLMLLFLSKSFGNRQVHWLTGFLVLASASSVWIGQQLLLTNTNAVFYLMPFRLSEFAAGALVVWLPRNNETQSWIEELVFAVGLGLVLYSVVTYHTGMPFPGVNALPPTIGAAMIIYAGQARILGGILNNQIMVWIGLISYALYLVHWPLLVFTELALMRKVAGYEILLVMVTAFLLAWIITRYIELPIRDAPHRLRHLQPAAFGLACAGVTITLLWIAATIVIGHGWSWRIPQAIREPLAGIEMARNAREARIRTGTCHMNMWQDHTAQGNYVDERCLRIDPQQPNYLLLGDSYGADRYIGLSSVFPEVNFLQMTTAACRPLLDMPEPQYHCRERMAYAFRTLLPQAKIDGVILAGGWQQGDLDLLAKTLAYLHQFKLRVIVFGPAAEFSPWVVDLVFHHGKREGLEEWVSRFIIPERFNVDRQVRKLCRDTGAEYYSSIEALCPNGLCPVISADNKLLVVDHGHQSPEGAIIQVQGFKRLGLTLPRLWPVMGATAK